MKFGYKRYLFSDSDDTQLQFLPPLDRVFVDYGAYEKNQLMNMINELKIGDSVFIEGIVALGVSINATYRHSLAILEKGAEIYCVREDLFIRNPSDLKIVEKFIVASVHGVSELRQLGISEAKKNKKFKGRKPLFSEELIKNINVQGLTKRQIARKLKISIPTVYKYFTQGKITSQDKD